MKRNSGFTLIEVMIVVVIIGILATIAMPSYLEYVRKAARGQAKSAILDVSQSEERFYSNNNSYVAFDRPGGSAVPPAGWNNFAGNDLGSRKYDISVAAVSGSTIATSYVITATPANGFSDATCGILTLSSTGAKGSSGAGSACW